MNWRTELPLAIVDTETTGTDWAVDRVVEVAVITTEGGIETGRKSWLVNPGVPIPAAASEIHGITNADITNAPRFAEIAVDLAAFIGEHQCAGYNARFDRAMLLAEYLRAGSVPPRWTRAGEHWIDVYAWAKAHNPFVKKVDGGHKLGSVADRFGVAIGTAHRALGDCETTIGVLTELSKVRLHHRSGIDRIPDDIEDLILHQRRIQADNEAGFLAHVIRTRNAELEVGA